MNEEIYDEDDVECECDDCGADLTGTETHKYLEDGEIPLCDICFKNRFGEQ